MYTLIKKSLIVLSAAFCLAGCGSYNISVDKNDANEQTTKEVTEPANTTEQAATEPAEASTEKTETTQPAQQQPQAAPKQEATTGSSVLRTETDNSYDYVEATAKSVNVRGTADIKGKIVDGLDYGEYVEFLHEKVYTSDNRIWLKVRTNNGITGYVSSLNARMHTSYSSSDYSSDYTVVVIYKSEGNVRSNTNQNDASAVIETASAGATYEYTGRTIPAAGRDWYEVYASNGQIGYISSRVGSLR